MPLTLILAEAALELVPRSIAEHPSVVAHAERRGRKPNEILLDMSYHYSAMRSLKQFEKRGRPDIVHFSILEALGSPLNKEGQLETWIHTIQDEVIRIDSKARIPRNYDRFVGLVEQLFRERRVPPKGKPLLQIDALHLHAVIDRTRPTKLVALSTLGHPSTFEEICRSLAETDRPAVMIGCFARGHFTMQNAKLTDQVFSVDREPLDSWVVTSRIIYEYECALKGFHESRLARRLSSPKSSKLWNELPGSSLAF